MEDKNMEKDEWTEHENACGICKWEKVLPEHTDLATIYLELLASWDPNNYQKPVEVSTTSNKAFWWVCENFGRRYMASVRNRVMGHGCPYDAGKKI